MLRVMAYWISSADDLRPSCAIIEYLWKAIVLGAVVDDDRGCDAWNVLLVVPFKPIKANP